MADLFNTIISICGVSMMCCCTLLIGLTFVLVSRGRIMVLPVILSFAGSFLANGIGGIFGIFGGRGDVIEDEDELVPSKRDLRSRAESIKKKYDPLDDGGSDEEYSSQSAKPRVSGDRFSSQSAKPPSSAGNRFTSSSANRPPSSSSSGSSSALPPPRANLTRKPNTDIARKRPSVDDDFDSLDTPSLRDRRGTRRRQNSNDYDDEVMGGIYDDDDDGLI